MMESLFRLHQVLSAKDVRLSARCESGHRELLAFVTGCNRLTLCYNGSRDSKTTVKVLPWFQDTCKRIAALAFDPSCTWLLAAGRDGSLYVVPALALVAPSLVLDTRWSTTDITLVADARTNGSTVAVAWWHCQMECQHVAVLAMSSGEIVLVNLTDRARVGGTNIGRNIAAMRICQDPYLDAAFLLVSDMIGQQWRLLLEQRSTGFTWPMDSLTNTDTKATDTANHNTLGVPTARSRLHGLKQLSVEKLASLRQRLAESRTKGGKDSPEPRSRTPDPSRRGSTGSSSDDCKDWAIVRPMAEQLSADTLLLPQIYRHRSVISALYKAKNIVTIHPMKTEAGLPLSAHKLATSVSDDLLLTDNFLFVADIARQQLTVLSTAFSECRLDGDCEHNPDAVLDHFDFPDEEKILSIFRLSGCEAIGAVTANPLPDVSKSKDERSKSNGEENKSKEEKHSKSKDGRSKSKEDKSSTKEERGKTKEDRSRRSRSRGKEEPHKTKEFVLPTSVAELELECKPVDTCVVVTTAGVYKLQLKRDSVTMFMELVLERGELELAERLALILRLDLQRLLELAGDLQLSRSKFQQATALYRLSRCRHLKSVLKLAAVGNSAALLRYVEDLLATVGSNELSASERIHLANLAVMAHADLLLRADQKPVATKRFINFLSTNQCYDQVLAVNVAGQTRLWKILHYLSSQRGLYPELLDVLSRVLGALIDSDKLGETDAPSLDADLWMAAGDPSLLPHMLAKPRQCSQHLANIRLCLSVLPHSTLQRLADMLDPTSVNFRPTLKRMFKSDVNQEEPMSSNVGTEVILAFILVVARLVRPTLFEPHLMTTSLPHPAPCREHAQRCAPPCGLVGAGFAHAALVRNAGLYTWGSVQHGCLGTGPTVSRFQPAQPVQVFTSSRVKVLAVTCGRQHTLALTNNGVYAWGSNQFGQLGVGRSSRSSWPMSVSALAEENVVELSAGQYHSLALTVDGRVFSWGWAIHGQLGTGSIEDVFTPTLVPLLPPIAAISAGHAHSLALANDGAVFAFGSAMFGQLGTGSLIKQTRPVHVVRMIEPVVQIATGYFHNLALAASGSLYTWGLSPQSLRLQVQAHKKQRLMHKHAANHSEVDATSPSHTEPEVTAIQSEPELVPANQGEEESLVKIIISDVKSVVIEEKIKAANANEIELRTSDKKKAGETSPESPSKAKKSLARSLHDYFTDNKEVQREKDEGAVKIEEKERGKRAAREETKAIEQPRGTLDLRELKEEDRGAYVIDQPTQTSETKREDGSQSEDRKHLQVEPPAYPAEEATHGHVIPSLVDTSLVTGKIVQVATGGHHSALVTDEGALYTWGRNLEGQLGCGGRREVTKPTKLLTLESFGDKTTVKEVACGSEFTVALTSSRAARVLAWGCNSSAQLGKAPTEDGKALDGKIVMIKTVKRVIKLPHGSNNAVDLPREVPGLGNVSITFRSNTSASSANILRPIKRDISSLHYLMIRLHYRYDSASLSTGLLDLQHYQLAGTLASIEHRPHHALRYHLLAVEASVNFDVKSRQISSAKPIVAVECDAKEPAENSRTGDYVSSHKPKEITELSVEVRTSTRNEVEPIEEDLNQEKSNSGQRTSEFSAITADNVEINDISEVKLAVIDETSNTPVTSDLLDENGTKESVLVDHSTHVAALVDDLVEMEATDEIKFPRDVSDLRDEVSHVIQEKPFIGFQFPGGLVNAVKHLAFDLVGNAEHKSKDGDGVIQEEKFTSETADQPITFDILQNLEGKSNDDHDDATHEESSSETTDQPMTNDILQSTDRNSNDDDNAIKEEMFASEITAQPVTYDIVQNKEQNPIPDCEIPICCSNPSSDVDVSGDSLSRNPIKHLAAYDITTDRERKSHSQTESESICQENPRSEVSLSEASEKCDISIDREGIENLASATCLDTNFESESSSQLSEDDRELGHSLDDESNRGTDVKTPDTEIHAFSVQGGTEEMSEGGSTVTTPSDSLSAPPITPVDDIRPIIEEAVIAEQLIKEYGPKMNAIEPNIETKSIEFEIDANESHVDIEDCDEAVIKVTMATQASQVVEFFLGEVDGKDEPLLAAMLTEALDFWWRLQLPVEPLESALSRHSTVFYTLGTIIFKDCEAEGPGSMLGRFTSQFCLQVCSYLTSHIDLDKPHPEFLDLLRTTQHGANGCSLASVLPVPSLEPSH